MKKQHVMTFFLIASIIFAAPSCTKDPGTGGTSSISGKIFVKDYNASFTTLLNEYYAPEQRVYIIYGDNEVYSDDMRTHYNGSYRFDNLRKGTYHIFAYSKDSTQTSPSGLVHVMKTVEITANNQQLVIEDIVIFD